MMKWKEMYVVMRLIYVLKESENYGDGRMKDIFNGQIRADKVKSVIVGLAVFDIICILSAIVFLSAGMNTSGQTREEQMIVCALGWSCIILAVVYPMLAVYFARRAKKHPRFAQRFIHPRSFQ